VKVLATLILIIILIIGIHFFLCGIEDHKKER
jgi:hypothetical protein